MSTPNSSVTDTSTTGENFGDWVADFGLDGLAAPTATNDLTNSSFDAAPQELPTDAAQLSGDANSQGPPAAEAAGEEAATEPDDAATTVTEPQTKADSDTAAPPARPDDDPDLTPAENEIVRSRPKAEWGQTRRAFKAARLEAQFLNPAYAPDQFIERLQQKSPSRFADLESALLTRRLSDPDGFARDLFQRSPEEYGKLALSVFHADPDYFIRELTGREAVSATAVRQALDLHDRYSAGEMNGAAGAELFTPEELEELEQFFPDQATKLRQAQSTQPAQSATASTDPRLAELEAKLKGFEEQQTTQRQEQARQEQARLAAESSQIWDAGEDHLESFLREKAEQEFGLTVTAQEREGAPLVALLKQLKSDILFEGLGTDIPDFKRGLGDWGKSKPNFMESLQSMLHYAQRRERDNALSAADALKPHADAYLNERLRLPIFKQLDDIIGVLTAGAEKPPHADETFVPGQAAAHSQQAPSSDPLGRINDWLVSDALRG